MPKRVRCKRLLCRRLILEQTSRDNGGLCAPCFNIKYPFAKSDEYAARIAAEAEICISDLTDRQKRSQLHVAICRCDEPRIQNLLDGDTLFLDRPPSRIDTWLGIAISNRCSFEVLEELLSAGCDVNACSKSPDQTRPLEIAVNNDQIETVEWLLGKGADPNLGRPIVAAINFRKPAETQLSLLKLLIHAGADVNQTFARYGDESDRFTVLDHAELYGISAEVTDYLKSNGAQLGSSPEKISERKKGLKPRRIV